MSTSAAACPGAGAGPTAPHAFIDQAYRVLAARPDPALALETIKALVALRLGVPARELLQWADLALAAAGFDTAPLRRSLAPLPAGRVPWSDLEDTFAANAQELRTRRPDVAFDERALRRALEGAQLFRSAGGHLHLSRRPGSGLREWIGGFTDGERAEAPALPVDPAGPPAAVAGLRLDSLVERVREQTRPAEAAAAQPVYVIDDQPIRAAAWLFAAGRRALLADSRVLLFLGEGALDRYERCLRENEDLTVPGALLSRPGDDDLAGRVAEIGRRVMADRVSTLRSLTDAQRSRSKGRPAAELAARLRPGATVIGCTSRFTTMLQYSMRDIGAAIEALGYRFQLVIERDDHRCHTTLTTSRTLLENDPALVIIINHLRCEQPASLGTVPILTWIQDPTPELLSTKAGASIGPRDFVCGYYATRCTGEFGYPPRQVMSVPFFPISERMFHDGPLDPAERATFECDVMYAGHCPKRPEALRDEVRSHHAPEWRPLLDDLYETVLERARTGTPFKYLEAEGLVRDVAAARRIELAQASVVSLAHFYAFRLLDIAWRTQTLEWVARWAERTGRRFRLFGRGWQEHPALARFAQGPIEHGPALRSAYRGAALAIQAAPHGFWHQRSFEAAAAGTLVLTRFAPADFADRSMADYRRLGLEGAGAGTPAVFPRFDQTVFDGPEAFESLAERYLADLEARRAVAAGFRATVLRSFTYGAVMPRLIEQVRAALAESAGGPPAPEWRETA